MKNEVSEYRVVAITLEKTVGEKTFYEYSIRDVGLENGKPVFRSANIVSLGSIIPAAATKEESQFVVDRFMNVLDRNQITLDKIREALSKPIIYNEEFK